MATKVITRFPPSPTGPFHIGSARTALFNYLFAKQHEGVMLLRFEDTDMERTKKEYETDILEGLAWLGIEYDMKNVIRQSVCTDVYKKYLEKLIEQGALYEAEENKDGYGKVIRFRNPNKEVSFDDVVRGRVTFNTTELGDFIVAKDLNTPLYHLAVVVDDHETHVTHVIRGEDHISNTPRQILLQEALSLGRPQYAHIPLILAPDRSKLSKRHGAVSVSTYRENGYLSEALVNYIALLGWNPGTNQEIFSVEELVKSFDLTKVQKGGAVFDSEKFNWMNRQYIANLSDKNLKAGIAEYHTYQGDMFDRVLPIIRERIATFSDVRNMIDDGELDYFFEPPEYDMEELSWKDTTREKTIEHLEKLSLLLESAPNFTAKHVKEVVWEYANQEGKGSVLWPLRYALSGREKSPDPFIIASTLGKEETLHRLRSAVNILSE